MKSGDCDLKIPIKGLATAKISLVFEKYALL